MYTYINRPKTLSEKHTVRINKHKIVKIYKEYLKSHDVKKEHKLKFEEIAPLYSILWKKVLQGIGYFFIWRIPRKFAPKTFIGGEKKYSKLYNNHTDGYVFSPQFVPNATQYLRPFRMDGKFKPDIHRAIQQNLKKGITYRNYLHTIKNFTKK